MYRAMQTILISEREIQTCQRKQKHLTKQSANQHMFSLTLSEYYDHKPLNIYECPVCKNYHVGHLNMRYASC